MCSQPTTESLVLTVKLMHMLCFNFIFSGLNFIFLSFKLIIINYHTQKYNTFNLNKTKPQSESHAQQLHEL